jgi:hypothetical protein
MLIVDERQFIKAELQSHGFDLFDFFDVIKVAKVKELCEMNLQRRSDILLVDTETLLNHPEFHEQFKMVLNTFLGVVFFHDQKNQKAQSWVQDQAAFLTKIVGEYSLPMPQLQWTMLSNQLQFFWGILQEQKLLQKHIAEFSRELDQVLITAESEMSRAKKIHEILIPKRTEEIKGVHFHNKYATGDGGGGEFYDLYQTPGKVFQILIASQSYLISSALMGILNSFKKNDFDVALFLQDCRNEVATINSAKKKKSEVELLVIELDLNELRLKAYGDSKAEFFSQAQGKVELSQDKSYQLSKGEKFVVFSPGFISNWKEAQIRQDVHAFSKQRAESLPTELLTEYFYQLRLDKESEFLKKDATVFMMEVHRHGIHEV